MPWPAGMQQHFDNCWLPDWRNANATLLRICYERGPPSWDVPRYEAPGLVPVGAVTLNLPSGLNRWAAEDLVVRRKSQKGYKTWLWRCRAQHKDDVVYAPAVRPT